MAPHHPRPTTPMKSFVVLVKKLSKLVRQREAVKEQQHVLKRGEETSLDYVKSINKNIRKSLSQQSTKETKRTRCGRGSHSKQNCPAKEATCHRALRSDVLLQNYCHGLTGRTRASRNILLRCHNKCKQQKRDKVMEYSEYVNGKDVCFKIDTGAEVSAISVSAISTDVFKADLIYGNPQKYCVDQTKPL